MNAKLYQFPDVYEAISQPSEELVRQVTALIHEHLRGPFASLMDFACGPGNWLVPFARQGVRVAGNDLSAHMVRLARMRLAPYAAEVVQGDMRDLQFASGPFDVAFEIAGTASYLHSAEELAGLLRGVARHVRPEGLVLVTLFFDDSALYPPPPYQSWDSGPVPINGTGSARVTYEVLERISVSRDEMIRRSIRTTGLPGAPDCFDDVYTLHIWAPSEVQGAIASVPELTLLSCHRVQGDRLHAVELHAAMGEVVVAMCCRGAEPPPRRLQSPA